MEAFEASALTTGPMGGRRHPGATAEIGGRYSGVPLRGPEHDFGNTCLGTGELKSRGSAFATGGEGESGESDAQEGDRRAGVRHTEAEAGIARHER